MRDCGVGGDARRRRQFVVAAMIVAAMAAGTGCGGGSRSPDSGSPASGKAAAQRGDGDLPVTAPARRVGSSDDAQSAQSRLVVRLERDLDMHETAARALGRIGAAAVPELRRALADGDPAVRIQAAEVLARIGPEAESAVPDLIVALEDENEGVRKAAARALGQIGPAAAPAVPALMRSMRESEELLPPSRPNGQ